MIRSQKKLSENIPAPEKLSQPEELLLTYAKTSDWFRENTRVVGGAGLALIAIVVGLYFWNSKRVENNERAEAMLSRVAGLYQSGDWRRAIDGDAKQHIGNESLVGLRSIVNEFGSTHAGEVAKVYLGNAYYYLGKLDSALDAFNDASVDGSLLKAAVESGKATIFEDKGNKAEAAKLFMRAAAAEKINPMNADYTLAAARNYASAGNKDEAIKVFKKILEDYPGTQFDDAAKRELLKLNVLL
ncbi:MAG: tetratricopeptide repeat protein [bacterium]